MRRVLRIATVPATVVAELAVAAALVLFVHLGQGETPGTRTVAWQALELYVAFVAVLAVWDYGGRAWSEALARLQSSDHRGRRSPSRRAHPRAPLPTGAPASDDAAGRGRR